MAKYRDKEWLKREYINEKRSTTDIAEECGVTHTTIQDWLDRHGIHTRSQRQAQKPKKRYTKKQWLTEQYVERERSMSEIAQECRVSAATILKWLRRFDIETRDPVAHTRKSPPNFYTTKQGYEMVRSKCDGDIGRTFIHQLVTIASGADPKAVFSDGNWQCHHKNGIPWDNRPQNIEFLHASDHADKHWPERERAKTGEFL